MSEAGQVAGHCAGHRSGRRGVGEDQRASPVPVCTRRGFNQRPGSRRASTRSSTPRSTVRLRGVAADPSSTGRPDLGPGAPVAVISSCLHPEDRERFDAAREEARRLGDVRAEKTAIERWRGIAILQAAPERYAATVRRLAERKTARPIPPGEPLSVTRRAAGL